MRSNFTSCLLRILPDVVSRCTMTRWNRRNCEQTYSSCSRSWDIVFLITFQPPPASAQTPAHLKTRNVVLIVSDGLRWQEIFTGADPTLMNSEHGGIWATPRNSSGSSGATILKNGDGAVPFLVERGRQAGTNLRQSNQGQRGPGHERPGLLLSGLQRDADRTSGPAHQQQRVRPESERQRLRMAEPGARPARPGGRVRGLARLQGHLQREAQPLAHANRGTMPGKGTLPRARH